MNENSEKIILHLCADIGSDSLPYKENGYDVRCIGRNIGVENYHPPKNVYGVIANPLCTEFSRGKAAKFQIDLRKGMFLVQECLRIIWECLYDVELHQQSPNLKFWVIENPSKGFLRWFLGNPVYTYQPYEFGENYSKETALWGMFSHPIKPLLFMPINAGRSITDLTYGFTEKQRAKRDECPYPFAKAFFEANQ